MREKYAARDPLIEIINICQSPLHLLLHDRQEHNVAQVGVRHVLHILIS